MKFSQFDFPTTMIIFGATGDLSQKKLIPVLFDLFKKDYLPSAFRVVGFSRDGYSDEKFRSFVHDVLKKKGVELASEENLASFLELFYYQQGTFEDGSSYTKLSEVLLEIDNGVGRCMNKLFYLAVPPTSYEMIFKNLSGSGLTMPCSDSVGWTRVLVEKPFGKDLETAKKLDLLLGSLFQEKQIFRIDHYLAKEAVQDILTFRFSNTIFEPIWDNRWIEKVEIKLWEDIDIAARAEFYNDVGALRDVGQNHVLQMLALIAMEHPGVVESSAVQASRAEVFKNLKLAGPVEENALRAQYEGFKGTDGVPGDSQTETYFKLKVFVENDRWRGVPFYLEGGKAMKEKTVEITVTFKGASPCFCPKEHDMHEHQNRITFSIQPTEKIVIRFWAKRPGIVSNVIPQDLSFDYSQSSSEEMRSDAYEKVLFDCIAGDQTLFASTDEVTASWAFITPILEQWKNSSLDMYAKGSSGPEKKL